MADRVADVSTHSRPKAAALLPSGKVVFMMFQHTAARRRLILKTSITSPAYCFNTQPPEGGCFGLTPILAAVGGFNTQPPEGG